MKKILFLAIFAFVLGSTLTCPQGQLQIGSACVTITYIPGCVQYSGNGICNVCQYGYQSVGNICKATDKPTTQCCVLTDNNGTCTQCAPGLYLNGNSCLGLQMAGCLQGNAGICTNCASDYTNVNGRCLKPIDSCTSYNTIGQCIGCATGYQLINGLCSLLTTSPLIPNCALTNQYGCIQCNSGFYLYTDRTCQQNQAGCIKYNLSVCQACSSNFQLSNGRCLMDGCNTYGGDGCISCSSGYTLQNGRCILPNCLQSQNGQCMVCQQDYRIANGACIQPIPDKCTSCGSGFFVGQDGKCYPSITGCLTYSSTGSCSSCQNLFVLSSGICVIPGCTTFGTQGCQVCAPPFKVSGGICVIDYCKSYNYQAFTCTSCNIGYHIEGGICVVNNPLCQTYALNGNNEVCSACASPDTYILTSSFTCELKLPGCVYQYGNCISCAYPFTKSSNGSCIIDGCTKYNLTGCLICNAPYQLNLGACVLPNCDQVSNGLCTKCSSGYHLVSGGQCVQDDPRCTAYLGGVCQGCISGYTLGNDGVCVKSIPNCKTITSAGCIECVSGYQVILAQCSVIDKNCAIVDVNGKGCSQCMSGYHTQSGICIINNPTCLSYSNPAFTQICAQCISGYVFSSDGTKCIQKIPGCIYDSYGNCASCLNPFTFSGNGCTLIGCSKYSDTGCLQCTPPFQLNGNVCIVTFCDSYDSVSCTSCQAGYQLIQGQCTRSDPKCLSYNTAGQCVSCVSQYTLVSGVCIKIVGNCQTYATSGCMNCQTGYYLSVDGFCLPQEPGCVYQQGKCVLCNYPFKFNTLAQTCLIDGCLEAINSGCIKCQFPYTIINNICQISNCVTVQDNHCTRCSPGYHLKQGMTCQLNDVNCLQYNDDGDCQICLKGYLLMSSGECHIAEDNCIDRNNTINQCVACVDGYFVNTFFQCQLKDQYCIEYINGFCSQCDNLHFLYQMICFPYSPGCVSYVGKDCVLCKPSYTLVNGECFALKTPGLQLEGNGDQYNFDITPIDITKSKYYIDNLSPISKLGLVFYSSFLGNYTDCRLTSVNENLYPIGWKAQNARSGQYVGYSIDFNTDPVTFYALQIEDVEGNYIKSFYLQYSVDGINYIRISTLFDSSACATNLTTIYFTGIYARAIRIIVQDYYGWPAARIEFFYYDLIRFLQISNLKSLTYLQEAINSNFVDRVDNQLYINENFYFQPGKTCANPNACFTGLELCQPKQMTSLSISATGGVLQSVYIMYSIDGKNYNCFQQCNRIVIDQTKPQSTIILGNLSAQSIRVYPGDYTGTPSIHISYSYS